MEYGLYIFQTRDGTKKVAITACSLEAAEYKLNRHCRPDTFIPRFNEWCHIATSYATSNDVYPL